MNYKDLEQLYFSGGLNNGILFDLDGTIADTMELHFKAYRSVIEKMGGTLDRSDFFKNVGPPAKHVIPIFATLSGLGQLKEDDIQNIHSQKKKEFAVIIDKQLPAELPAIDILKSQANRKKIGVVTSGNNSGAKLILERLEILDLIDVLITSDDVIKGKPDKEPYEKALKSIGLEAYDVIAFEDTQSGVNSALAAGIKVVNVVSGILELPNDK